LNCLFISSTNAITSTITNAIVDKNYNVEKPVNSEVKIISTNELEEVVKDYDGVYSVSCKKYPDAQTIILTVN
jgi:hypothetical protein